MDGGRFCFTKSWIRISTSGTKRTKAQLEGKSVVGFDADLKLDAERSNYSEDAQRLYETMNMPPLAT